MKRKRQYKKRYKKSGRGIPYVYNNRIYFGKKPQKGTGPISKFLGYLLQNVGDIIGL